MNGLGIDGPKGLEESGAVPTTRMQNAAETQNRVLQLREADDQGRARRRAMVKGLVDGNPPYRPEDLRNAGRSDACNVNWREAEAYLNSSIGAFYDVFSESATFATVELDTNNPLKNGEWSRIVTEEFHQLLAKDKSWDYTMQNSQYEMVLYGIGPLLFENDYDWRCCSIQCKDLLVPNYTKSDVTTWEEAAVMTCYLPHQLYEMIQNTKTATAMGWNVPATRRAIMKAHPKTQDGGQYGTWEWHQMQLKTQSYCYSAESKVIEVSHYYLREFPTNGDEPRITHCIVQSPLSRAEPSDQYLYQKIGRFECWEEIIHPMYYDNLGGGLHHSVTGMGTKMFSALEFQNRLMCSMADQAFAPKLLFKPTTANSEQQLSLVRIGNYAKIPGGFDLLQQPLAGMIEESLAFNRHVGNLVSSNLSQYRQNLETKEGNPRTATEISQRASEQARLGKTQLNRYYNQLDWLYSEKYRRAIKVKADLPGGKDAAEFRKKCRDRGVPESALDKTRFVKATRIVGQGSEYLRQASLEFLLGLISLLPESGRQNLIGDVIAARAGQFMVDRYFPRPEVEQAPDDQLVVCMNQIGSAKNGVPPVVTDTQNHPLFAGTFLRAAAESLASVQQGADPVQVLTFLEALGPAIAKHISIMAQDKSRKAMVDEMSNQWKQLAQATEQLRSRLSEQQQAQMEQVRKQQQVMNDQQLKQWEAQQEQQRKQAEFEQSMQHRSQKMQQQLAAKDVQLAQQVKKNTVEMAQQIANNEQRNTGQG